MYGVVVRCSGGIALEVSLAAPTSPLATILSGALIPFVCRADGPSAVSWPCSSSASSRSSSGGGGSSSSSS